MSYPFFKSEAVAYLKEQFPSGGTALDVGCGDGAWSDYLKGHFAIDAIEVYEPYLDRYGVRGKYRSVFVQDARSFRWKKYDVVIMGDVLEHLAIEDARTLVIRAKKYCNLLLIAVPYLYEQGAYDGNEHEEHKQPDLTPEIFNERYPGFSLIFGNDKYGYYVWRVGQ